MSDPKTRLTVLFERFNHGDAEAAQAIVTDLYAELRRLAASRMRSEGVGHTLQPTALVSEAYLRLVSGPGVIHDRAHFFALAAQAMRRVLVDHARRKRAQKRGGGAVHVTVDHLAGESHRDIDVLALEEALEELERLDPRAARVVELRFYGGCTDKEVAQILDINFARVRRDWEFARGWLRVRLGAGVS